MHEANRTPRWSEPTDRVLRKSGWYPQRSVPTVTWESILRERGGFVAHEAAQRFLAEFGGLHNDGWPAGPDTAKSPFRVDPLRAQWDRATFHRYSTEAGVSLYPVGQANNRTSYLAVAENGAVYLGEEEIRLLAPSGDEALDRLVGTRCSGSQPGEVTWVARPVRNLLGDEAVAGDGGDSSRWSEATSRTLRRAGWYPGRAVPVDTWEKILHDADGGFRMPDAARTFLAEFGGVALDREDLASVGGRGRDFQIDPLLAKWDFEIFEEMSEEVENYLYPLGMTDRGNFYLSMTEGGEVYVGMDYPNLLADNGHEAMRKLIEGLG
ncbi:SUKH-3 domain-containing protein [Streptomyces sp. Je 1-332]|uniref:SUKH-3 domain-containing protein n=1 Tax=Streptomyces sp. Je 1-332 TaxID=3231270 RepID=UPI00345B0895